MEKQAPLPPLPLGEGRGEGSSNEKNLPPLSDETIQSNQRLADSLKTRTGVGDLPKFTSDAINTDGPKAIPEIVDLIREVEASDPKQARELYQRTFEGIAPENQQQLEENYMMYNSGGEDKEQEDDLANDWNVNHRKVVDDGGNVEVAQVPQSKPSQPIKAPPPSDPRFKSIDWNFINDNEGFSLDGKPPINSQAGKIAGKSGITLGAGVDMGQMNTYDLDQLVKNHGLSPAVAAKVKPYLGAKNQAAQALYTGKDILTQQEAFELTHAKHSDTLSKLSTNVDRIRGARSSFDKLPDPVKTVYYDLAVQEGPDFLNKAPNMKKHLQNGDVKGMIHELNNYYQYPSTPNYLKERREKEAGILEGAVNSGILKPRF